MVFAFAKERLEMSSGNEFTDEAQTTWFFLTDVSTPQSHLET
jgi:hypothetical protein